jgi:O-acetylhomoserine sulfhydrylase
MLWADSVQDMPIYNEKETMMSTIDPKRYGPNTRAVRAGQVRSAEGEHSELIFATSSYVFKSAAEAAARFAGDKPGNIYSRFTNPTVRTFEERLAALEGGERCIATSSGMGAILSTCLGLLKVAIMSLPRAMSSERR